MATYFLQVKTLGRRTGARATRAAAYRAGERIRDERSSDVFNFSDRDDVVHKEILLPAEFDGDSRLDWARDRSTLWNAVEYAGHRRNSLLAREVLVILPSELTHAQRTALVQGFAQDLANRYRNAVDVAVHAPRPGSDERHYHAHLLMTTREVTPQGLAQRTTLELSGTERHARGLGPSKADYLALRERWAQVTNEALLEAGVAGRIDHRSLKAQGIDREPTPMMPQKVYYAERRSGEATRAGDDIRARHRERVQARLKGEGELARVIKRQKEDGREHAMVSAREREGLPKKIPRSALTREELNERRRERYHANAERLNQERRERYGKNAQSERRKYREWRSLNADAVNERRKQWRLQNADKVNQRQREYYRSRTSAERDQGKNGADTKDASLPAMTPEAVVARSASVSDTEQQAAQRWLEYTQKHSASTREQTAEQSAQNWLEYQERQKQAELASPAAPAPSREREEIRESKSRQRTQDRGRHRDHDSGL